MILTLVVGLLLAAQTAPAAQAGQSSTPSVLQSEPANQPKATKLPRPNPDASGKYHIGDGVSFPRVMYQEEPILSKMARKMKMNGSSLIGVIVDSKGMPQNIHVVRSAANDADENQREAALTLDQSALDAVKEYRFAPAKFNGKPVPVELNIEVNMQFF
jgi:TonB family protein